MTRSDSPPSYDSALSKKFTPASYAACRQSVASATPTLPPNVTHEPSDSTLSCKPERPSRRYSMFMRLPSRARSLQLRHVLVEVEVVAPRGDLPVFHLERPHDRKLDRAVGKMEDVDALRQHGVADGRDVAHLELETVDRAHEHVEQREYRVVTDRGIDRD